LCAFYTFAERRAVFAALAQETARAISVDEALDARGGGEARVAVEERRRRALGVGGARGARGSRAERERSHERTRKRERERERAGGFARERVRSHRASGGARAAAKWWRKDPMRASLVWTAWQGA
jgi:hypothetical protein